MIKYYKTFKIVNMILIKIMKKLRNKIISDKLRLIKF